MAQSRRSPHRHGPSRVLDKAAVRRAYAIAAKDLATRLRTLREACGWGIEEAAEAAGMHPKHLQRLERLVPAPSHEPNVTLKTLAALATAYGVPIAAIFDMRRGGPKKPG